MKASDLVSVFEKELRGIVGYLVKESLADEARMSLRRYSVRGQFTRLDSKYWIDAPKAHSKKSYEAHYVEVLGQGAYDVRLLDGALLQFQYEFTNRGELSRSVQRYLPSPDLTPFQEDPELYFKDELYGDVVGSSAVCVPVRFDFDNRAGVAQARAHPASHLTLGQYTHCRIAAAGAVTPYYFVEFLLRAFYRTSSLAYSDGLPAPLVPAKPMIEDDDRRFLHIGLDTH